MYGPDAGFQMCYWKQWKKIKTKYDNLIKHGIDNFKAWEYANTRKGYWRISNSPILTVTFTKTRLKNLGYLSFTERYAQVAKFLTNRRIPNGTYGGVRGR